MINVSDAFKEAIQGGTDRGYLAEAQITLLNGTVLTVASSQIEENGIEIEDAVSGSESFSIGAAIAGKFTLVLNNRTGEFNHYDFFGAEVKVKIGLTIGANTTEYVKRGEYSVDDPIYGNGIITLECLDHMIKFDRPYSESKLTYPATLGQIVRDACDVCDVALLTTNFDHDDYVVNSRPADEAITFRKVLSWAAQIACKWAKCNANGQLVLGWYDWEAIRGDVEESRYHMISRLASLNVTTDDVVITGIKVVSAAGGAEEPESYLEGDEGYILSIEDNQLISAEDIETVASWLGVQLIGLRFRPFTAQHLSDPTIEAGDVVRIAGRNAIYYSAITSSIFSTGDYQESNCEAETPSRNSSSRYSESTKTYVTMRKLVREEQTARETAIERLEKTLGDGSGLYMSTEEMEDGSFIYYAHNKPTIEESDIIWLMTAEAIGISTDGGKTYPYGFVVDGELIARILQTEGVNADWINTGALVVKDASGNVILSVNMDTHEILMDADHIMIGDGKTLSQMVEESKSMHVILSNEYQGIPADSNGNITTFPTCTTSIQILYGQSDITGKCSISATASTGVTGSLSGTTYTVTALAADTGYVDIKATYLTMTATKRFTISKVKSGNNVKILYTDLSLTQEMLAERSAVGHNRNWGVITATDGLKAGDSVIIQVYNSSKGMSEAFIMATVDEVINTYRINATSAGLIDKGDSGRVYSLEPSATVIKRGQDSIPVPDVITFSAFYRDGNSASRTAYAGRFVVETSTDGNTWSKVYTSAADETSCKYELYTALEDGNGNYLEDGNGNVLVAWHDASTVMLRATLYAAGGVTSSLDMQTVPVVIDVAALTHWQIFNLLTNDGAWQGLFYENGHLYLSGECMKFIGANIGGWDIGEKAIYKNVVDPTDPNIVYCLYFQPPSFALDDPERTWVLSCQISRDGGKTSTPKFFICADGKIQMYSDDRKYMFEIAPPDDNNLDGSAVFTIWELNEDGTALVSKKTRLRSNGKFNLRQLLIDDPIEFPHVIGDGQYLQLSPVKGEAWGAVLEALNGGQWFYPATSGTMYLGSEEHKWAQIWSTNSAIATSDRKEKNSIAALDEDKWLNFLMGLRIVSYKLNNGTSGRLHHGMIAQDVEVLLNALGIDSKDFAGFIRWQKSRREERFREVIDDLGQKRQQRYFEEIPIYDEEGNPVYGYGLRYEEFLPMTIKAVQRLYVENQAILKELADLKQKVANLTN